MSGRGVSPVDSMTTQPETSIDDLLQHSSWVRQLAFSLTRDPNEAEELVQELWLRTLRKPPRLGVPVRTWLARVLHNTANTLHRSRLRRTKREREHATGMVTPSVMETLERADLHAFLAQAMQNLPAPDRALMAMRYLEDMPPRVLAQEFNIPVETVRKRLQRTRAVLREQLGRQFGNDWEPTCLALALLPIAPSGVAGVLFAGMQTRLVVAAAAVCSIGTAWVMYEVTVNVSAPTSEIVAETIHLDNPAKPPSAASQDDSPAPRHEKEPASLARSKPPQNRPPTQPLERAGAATTKTTNKNSPPHVSTRPGILGKAAPSTLASLNLLLQDWFAARLLLLHASAAKPADRRQAQRRERSKQEKFEQRWKEVAESNNLLGDLAALNVVFHNAFPAEKISSRSRIRARRHRAKRYMLHVPSSYEPNLSHALFLYLPAKKASSRRWSNPRACIEEAWPKEHQKKRAIAIAPLIPNNMLLNTSVDFKNSRQLDIEQKRLDVALSQVGDVLQTYRIDRNRFILVSGRGNSLFALRLATYFPSRFAGLVLRHPDWDGNLRLESLRNLPVLLIPESASSSVWGRLQQELDRVGAQCTVMDPYEKDPTGLVIRWGMAQRRDIMAEEISIAPNSPGYRSSNSAYWAKLGDCDALPLFNASVQRDSKTIMIDTHDVRSFTLYLNESLAPLDEFRVILNGVPHTYGLQPSLRHLTDHVFGKYDESRLFTAEISIAVPLSREK